MKILAMAFLAVFAPYAAAHTWEATAAADVATQVAAIRLAGIGAARPAPQPSLVPRGPAHQPEALNALLDLIQSKARAGARPVVIFDLDDTLINTGYRNVSIIREFEELPWVRTRFPEPAAQMSAISIDNVAYDLEDTLSNLGVYDSGVLPELKAFWAQRFFDNRYLLADRANAGGVDYVRDVLRRGGTVVYLTGRWAEMRPGTVESMARMGYPAADDRRVFLMLKPDRRQSDIDFKKVAFEDIARLGEVVGGFENEPANVNAYQQRFQTGIYVFLDTRHSTTAATPLPTVFWVRDFMR